MNAIVIKKYPEFFNYVPLAVKIVCKYMIDFLTVKMIFWVALDEKQTKNKTKQQQKTTKKETKTTTTTTDYYPAF